LPVDELLGAVVEVEPEPEPEPEPVEVEEPLPAPVSEELLPVEELFSELVVVVVIVVSVVVAPVLEGFSPEVVAPVPKRWCQ
jgi:hypothetical protein